MSEEAGNLILLGFIGFLLVMIGLTGRLGSVLGSIIDPGSMVESTQSFPGGVQGGGSSF